MTVINLCPNGSDSAVKAACETDRPKPKTVADYVDGFPRQLRTLLYKNQACTDCINSEKNHVDFLVSPSSVLLVLASDHGTIC